MEEGLDGDFVGEKPRAVPGVTGVEEPTTNRKLCSLLERLVRKTDSKSGTELYHFGCHSLQFVILPMGVLLVEALCGLVILGQAPRQMRHRGPAKFQSKIVNRVLNYSTCTIFYDLL